MTLRKVPDLDAARCVRSHMRGASCASCALACPAGALMPSSDGLDLDPDLCSGCGQCAGVCPSGALGAVALPPVQGGVLHLGCDQAEGTPTLACAHAPGLEDLARAWLLGMREIAIATGDCVTCADAPEQRLTARLARLNQLLAARGAAPVSIRLATRSERGPAPPVDPARRALFAALHPANDSSPKALHQLQSVDLGALAAFVPQIDAAQCSGCNACVQICPEGSLTLVKAAEGQLRYNIDGASCTGCALCVDICDEGAVSLESQAPPAPSVDLVSAQCSICGVSYRHPALSAEEGPPICQICQQKPHAKNLFQVLP